MTLLRRYSVIAIVGGLALAGCSSAASGAPAARVGTTVVSTQDLQRQLRAIAENPNQRLRDQVLKDGTLSPSVVVTQVSNDVNQVILDEMFTARKLSITNADRARARAEVLAQFAGGQPAEGQAIFDGFATWFTDQLVERQAIGDAVFNSFVTADPTTYYQQHKAEFDQQCASGKVLRYILAPTQAQAEQLQRQLAAGADFATLARQSLDTSTAQTGGELGCYQPGAIASAEIDTALKNLVVGQRSIIPTASGFAVVEARPVNAETLVGPVRQAQRQEAGKAFSDELAARLLAARPEINPRFGIAVFGPDGFSIDPPGGESADRIRTMPATPAPTPNANPLTGR